MYEDPCCFLSGPACQLHFRFLGNGEVLTLNLNPKKEGSYGQ